MNDPKNIIPKDLMVNAYHAPDNTEYAWNRSDALDVIAYCLTSKILITGIEVWVPTEKGPIIPLYSLDTPEKNPNESWVAFVRTTCTESESYIKHFSWNKDDLDFQDKTPYFNIWFSTEEEFFGSTKDKRS